MATLSVRKTARWCLGKHGLLSLKHDIFSVNTGNGSPPLSLRNQLAAIHRDMDCNQVDERGMRLGITIDNPPGLGASAAVVGKRITVTGDVSYEYYLGGEFGPPPENWIHFVDYVEVSAGSVVQRAVKNGSTWSRWEAHLTLSDDSAAKGITEIVARVYSDNLMAQSRPHSWFVYTLYPYPENELEILRAYLPPDLRQQVPHMIAALKGSIHEGLPWGLDSLHDKRRTLKDFLETVSAPTGTGEGGTQPTLLDEMTAAIQAVRHRSYVQAAATLDKVKRDPSSDPEAPRSIEVRGLTNFEYRDFYEALGPGYSFVWFGGTKFESPGYRGYQPTPDQILRLSDLSWLARRGHEYRLRIALLQAECFVGQRQFQDAIAAYETLAAEIVRALERYWEHSIWRPVYEEEYVRIFPKLLAVRSALAHLARGDQLYRSTRDLSSDAVKAAVEHYHAAVKVVQDHEVSEANPFHQAIKDYANKRLIQLSNSLNFLGYSNTYVRAKRFGGLNDNDSLFGLARARLSTALRVKGDFERYLQAAEQTQRAAAEAQNGGDTAKASIRSAEGKRKLAGARRDGASARLESVKRKNEFLKIATFLDVIKAAGETIRSFATGGPLSAVDGAISFGVKTAASLEEMSLEEKLAGFDLRIAESEVRLADLEILNAASQARFFEEQRAFLVQGAELNLEVYYALAREYARLTEAHMEAAINLAFLAERRAAFERGAPTLPQVQFEYLTPVADGLGVGSCMIAPDRLDGDLLDLNEAFQQGGQVRTDFDLQISLRANYPIEFFAFLQSGILPFKISLFDLERLRPGTSDQRIRTVHIDIIGLGGAVANVSGRLRHSGTFMVRDRASAVDAERLLPTPEELEDALAMFQQGRTSTVTTKGVTLWQVDPHEQELTNLEDDPDIEEFRDYGLTGVWEFELLRSENPDIPFHQLTDIIIRINGTASQGDPGFRAHIRELVRKYEQEQQPAGQDEPRDRTTAVLMEATFPGAFDDFLATGAMTFQVRAAEFPDPHIENTKVKTVLFQALDEEGTGVEGVRLIVSKEGMAVTFERTTLADGFSENLNTDLPFLEPARRFAMEGRWRLDAADPTRRARVADLIMFFIYEVPEEEG